MIKESAIGDLLVQAGIVDSSGLAHARKLQHQQPITVGRALQSLGLADEEKVCAAISAKLHLESLPAEVPEVSVTIAALLPAHFCRERLVAPLDLNRNTLRLSMTDPLDLATIQDTEFRTGKRVVAVVATETAVRRILSQAYPTEAQEADVFGGEAPGGEVEPLREVEFELSDPEKTAKETGLPPVVRLVNLILSSAAKSGASDIHMEPKESQMQVRYRVDGLLRDFIIVPRSLQDSTVSRLKILSGMDIAERRRSQDGRCRLRFEGKRIDLRISSLPTQFGEKLVIRLLDTSKADFRMDNLALSPEALRVLESMLTRPQGMILVTGPTGSGKSSTLYTIVNWLKSPTKNIITVEDPIEYQLEGVNQVQINTRAGVTFSGGLRSILRQDPNIILVGEIRDKETAALALEAAQTGHLLLSTLHTNDAPGTITRLLDLGIEPFLIASAVVGVTAQRLVRRVCPSCSAPQPLSPECILRVGGASRLPEDGNWVAGRGCAECDQSGYRGRIAIHQVLEVNSEVRELITRRAPEDAIRKAARSAGMKTLLEDGIREAAQGVTTLEEVLRVVATDDASNVDDQATNPNTATTRSSFDEFESPILSDPDVGANSVKRDTVLIVEDSVTIVSVVKYFLELEGFIVRGAKDGAAGLEMAKRHLPSVIVTDYNMPGMNGMELIKMLRSDPATRGIPVVMLTSEASVERESQALAVGADDYVLKPVEPRRLAARVKAALARSLERYALAQEARL